MRISVFVFFLVSLPLSAINDERNISIHLHDAGYKEVLNAITQQTGYRFAYNPQLLDGTKSVSFDLQNKTLSEVLSTVLPPDVCFKKKDKHIILHAKQIENIESENESNNKKDFIPLENINKNDEYKPLVINDNKNNLKKISYEHTGIYVGDCHNCVNLKNEKTMKKYATAMLILAASMTSQLNAQEAQAPQSENSQYVYTTETERGQSKPFQFSFIYPLGTDFTQSIENSYDVSLNLIGGVTGRSNGLELGSMFNVNKYSARGLQLAGAFNLAGYDFASKENSNVLQFSSAFNYANAGKAAQFTGGVNVAEFGTIQAGAGVNMAKEAGVQLTGGINVAQKSFFQGSAGLNMAEESSCQLTGGINIAKKAGFQGSAGVNIAQKAGCQITGGVNIAKESACQIACVNITGKGGFQLGVINVRDTADGVPVGLINIVKRGGLSDFGIEAGEFIQTAATFRSGTYRFYTIFSAGWNYSESLWSAGFGLGTGFRFTSWLGLNLELMHHNMYKPTSHNYNFYTGLVQIRPLLDFRIARRFKVFAGPTANLLIQHRSDDATPYLSAPYKALYNTQINDTKLDAWIGFTAGVRF
ncbi:STN domain-containing protein [Paludibacter sp. 221]|uniref:STN domain-containing protein n=1 Tax=Paludibacter sp. 221 TaxID=2302939 RepID=UPI0013CFBD96|nr:STN domain-containing protein [Paludibacter sp. 221]